MLKQFLLSKFVGPMIRHGAGVVGGYLMTEGYADAETAQAVSGGVMALGSITWSLFEKRVRF